MSSSDKLEVRESPAMRFAQENGLTERRTKIMLYIQEILDKHDFMIRTLMKMDPNILLKAQGMKPVPEGSKPSYPLRIGSIGLLAYPGVILPEWEYSLEEALVLPDYTRFLIISGSNDLPFYLHAFLNENDEVIWNWREIQAINEDILRPSVMVLKWSVIRFLFKELPEINRKVLMYQDVIETWRWSAQSEASPFRLPTRSRLSLDQSATA